MYAKITETATRTLWLQRMKAEIMETPEPVDIEQHCHSPVYLTVSPLSSYRPVRNPTDLPDCSRPLGRGRWRKAVQERQLNTDWHLVRPQTNILVVSYRQTEGICGLIWRVQINGILNYYRAEIMCRDSILFFLLAQLVLVVVVSTAEDASRRCKWHRHILIIDVNNKNNNISTTSAQSNVDCCNNPLHCCRTHCWVHCFSWLLLTSEISENLP